MQLLVVGLAVHNIYRTSLKTNVQSGFRQVRHCVLPIGYRMCGRALYRRGGATRPRDGSRGLAVM